MKYIISNSFFDKKVLDITNMEMFKSIFKDCSKRFFFIVEFDNNICNAVRVTRE
jgi:hypothetical protein